MAAGCTDLSDPWHNAAIVRHIPVYSSLLLVLVLVLGCSGSTSSTRGTPADDPGIDAWIEALDDPDRVREAAAALRTYVESEGGERAIEPLLRAWERHGFEPTVLEVATALAADGHGGPYWERVLPTLRTALDDATVSDLNSLESALVAVDAMASARDHASVPSLAAVARRSVADLAPGHRLRLAAIAALGAFPESDEAVTTLVGLLAIEPSHRVQVIPSAAALALGQTRSPKAVVPLLEALVRMPRFFPTARRALVAIGEPAIPELVAMLEGRQARLQAVANELELNLDCEREMGLGSTCPAPGLLRYRAAALLSDFPTRAAVDALSNALETPAVPVFFDRDGPGPDDHKVILESLGHLGDPAAAPAVWAYARSPSNKAANRAWAIEAYTALASDAEALPVLADMLADSSAGVDLKAAAALGYARTVRDKGALQPLLALASQPAPRTSGTEADALRPGYAHLARAHVGISCGADPGCHLAILERDTQELIAPLGAHIPDMDALSPDARIALANAARERALLDLGKLGAAAAPVLDALMERSAALASEELYRDALAAIVRIASTPCDQCVRELDRIIDAERSGAGRSWVLIETEIVRSYFTWAGR